MGTDVLFVWLVKNFPSKEMMAFDIASYLGLVINCGCFLISLLAISVILPLFLEVLTNSRAGLGVTFWISILIGPATEALIRSP